MANRAYPDLATFFEKSGVTQEQLAKRLGVSQAHISRIKLGLTDVPLSLAVRIAEEANIPIESLVAVTESVTEVAGPDHV